MHNWGQRFNGGGGEGHKTETETKIDSRTPGTSGGKKKSALREEKKKWVPGGPKKDKKKAWGSPLWWLRVGPGKK